MLSTPVPRHELRPGWAGEPKWDGFRALLSVDAGRVVLRSRRGTEMAASFPEMVAGAVQLPDSTAFDGELVVWDAAGRLAFERLQPHLLNGHLRSPGQEPVSDRDAVELLARAGFVDASGRFGQEAVATAAFGDGDVPRRQDLILASSALATALVGYRVHMEPVETGLSAHAAISADFDLGLLDRAA
ncbi:hypothetical protein [Streptomyces sp. WAC05858]|uniref:ATP-dependent DNA ligase n=1 Tax=Streptomyces TaxID=1883 RepID=UPI0021AE5B9F|nr:hypothetical protein [Streptomyces sp. WAC05858]